MPDQTTAPPDPPEEINAVLTFTDPAGRRWMAGAMLGPLVAEDDTAITMMTIDAMRDAALALVDFKVVRRA